MALIKFLTLFLAFLLITLAAADCATFTNPTCGELFSSCRSIWDLQTCRVHLCTDTGLVCGDCNICADASKTEFPTPTYTAPNTCATFNNPSCGEIFAICREKHDVQHCRIDLCETTKWGMQCDDCGICEDSSSTIFPTFLPRKPTSVATSSTLKTVTTTNWSSSTISTGITKTPVAPTITEVANKDSTPPAARSLLARRSDQISRCQNECKGIWDECRSEPHDVPSFCRNNVCETYSYACGDCPVCRRDLTTTWPAPSPEPTSLTRAPAPVLTMTETTTRVTLWPTNPPTVPSDWAPPVKRSPSSQEVLADAKDKHQCGFACNQDECDRICLTGEYIKAYKKQSGTSFIPDTSLGGVTIKLASGDWSCTSQGCRRASSDISKRSLNTRGDCWEVCDPLGHNCVVNCNSSNDSLSKRQCSQSCDKNDANCHSDCENVLQDKCWQQCDADGHNCVRRCSLWADVEKRQCQQACDKDGKCTSDCTDKPQEKCWEVCDEEGKNCIVQCSLIGDAERRTPSSKKCFHKCDDESHNPACPVECRDGSCMQWFDRHGNHGVVECDSGIVGPCVNVYDAGTGKWHLECEDGSRRGGK